MNTLNFISEPFTNALGWALVHALWQGTLLVAVAALAFRITAKSPSSVRYGIGIGALGGQLLAFLATIVVCYEPTRAVLSISGDPQHVDAKTALVMRFADPQPGFGDLSAWLNGHLSLLVTVWFLGAVLLLVRLVGGWLFVQRLTRRSISPAPFAWQTYTQQVARQLGITRAVRLVESAEITVPMTIGWLKPIVLIPIGLLAGLSPRQVEAVLAHELAHIRRYDYLVNLMQSAVEIVLFFHPALWWLSARVREEREHCCDDLAIDVCGERASLAQALVFIEERRQAIGTAPSLAMAFGARKQSFLQRVKRVIGVSDPLAANRPNGLLIAGCLVLLAGLVAGQNLYRPVKSSRREGDSITINTWPSGKTKASTKAEEPGGRMDVQRVEPAVASLVGDTIPPNGREKLENELEQQVGVMERQAQEMEKLHLPLEKLTKQLELHEREVQELTGKEMAKLQEKLQQLHSDLERKMGKSVELELKQSRLNGKLSQEEEQLLAKLQIDANRIQKQMEKLETGEMAKVQQKIQALTNEPLRQVQDSMSVFWEKAIKAYNDNMPYFIQLAEKHAQLLDSLPKPEPVPALAPAPAFSAEPAPVMAPKRLPRPARAGKPAGGKGGYWYNGKRYERPEDMPAALTPPIPPAAVAAPTAVIPVAPAIAPAAPDAPRFEAVPDAPAPPAAPAAPKARKAGKKGKHLKY
ncbi:hypothetical protein GCM10027299_23770 [Larkinella ripae]